MSEFLKNNLIFLRENAGLSQLELATVLGCSRSTYANWESGSNMPKSDMKMKIVRFFKITLDELEGKDLSKGNLISKSHKKNSHKISNLKGNPKGNLIEENKEQDHIATFENNKVQLHQNESNQPKIITVDSSGEENILYVPVKAQAGYLLGLHDPKYISNLPTYKLPGYNNGTYRIFEIKGHSMFNTLHDRDRLITRWEQVSEIKDDRVYVIITKNDGVLVKRVINRFKEGKLILKSDNNHNGEYPTIIVDVEDVIEAWYVVERWTRQLPSPGEIYKRIINLEAELELLKAKMH